MNELAGMAGWIGLALITGSSLVGVVAYVAQKLPKKPRRTRSKLERGREKVVK